MDIAEVSAAAPPMADVALSMKETVMNASRSTIRSQNLKDTKATDILGLARKGARPRIWAVLPFWWGPSHESKKKRGKKNNDAGSPWNEALEKTEHRLKIQEFNSRIALSTQKYDRPSDGNLSTSGYMYQSLSTLQINHGRWPACFRQFFRWNQSTLRRLKPFSLERTSRQFCQPALERALSTMCFFNF